MKILHVFALFFSINMLAQGWVAAGDNINGVAAGDKAGHAISLSADGSIVAVAAPYNDGSVTNAGHVRVFQNNAGNWTQIGADINGESAYDSFGYAVDLSADGSVVAIGAIGNDGNGSYAGHVRVYQNNAGNWTQIGADIDGEAEDDRSGSSVSLNNDGTVVAIGAIYNEGNGYKAGHVRVYQYASGVWAQVGADIDGEAPMDEFGYSVSLSADGSVVAIGAPYNSENADDAGHVRVFQNISGVWTQIGADIDGAGIDDFAGCSVSLSEDGSIVAVGAHASDSDVGHVRIYQNDNGSWTQIGQDINGDAGAHFGNAVSLNADGSVVAIGASISSINGYHSGQMSIYQNLSGTWTQMGSDIPGEATEDVFGISVAINADGSIVAGGAPNNDTNGNNAGNVSVFHYPLPAITNQPANQSNICPGSNVSFSVSGENIDAYQWQMNTGSGFTDITNSSTYTGATTGTLQITGVTLAMDNYQYRCIVSNALGDLTSDIATLTTDSENPLPPTLPVLTGECAVSVTPPTTTDNCAGTIVGTTSDPLYYDVQGSYNITWTFNDGNGNILIATQYVVVDDVTNPSLTCPGNQTIYLNEDETYYTVSGTEFDPLAAGDNCSLDSVTNNFNNSNTLDGAQLPIGTTNITWTATDEAGNLTNCSFDVIINTNVGIAELEEHGISIYPVPAKGEFTINNAGNYDITITDITGKTVYHDTAVKKSTNRQIRIAQSGVYIIRFVAEDQNFTTKIMIE